MNENPSGNEFLAPNDEPPPSVRILGAFARIPAFFQSLLDDKQSRGIDSKLEQQQESLLLMQRQWQKSEFPSPEEHLCLRKAVEPEDSFELACYKQAPKNIDEVFPRWSRIFAPLESEEDAASQFTQLLAEAFDDDSAPKVHEKPKEFTEGLAMIEKDVSRIVAASSVDDSITSEENAACLSGRIRSLLAAWLWKDCQQSHIGYAQGMTDICWVFCALFPTTSSNNKNSLQPPSDAQIYALFCSWMHRRGNFYFLPDSLTMTWDLRVLRKLLAVMQPELYSSLKLKGSLSMFFAYRWILLSFRREFPLWPDLVRLWEVLECNPFSQKYHLFVALAILEFHSSKLMMVDGEEEGEAHDESCDSLQMMGKVVGFFEREFTCAKESGLEMLLERAECIFHRWKRVDFLAVDEDLVQLKQYDK